MIDIKLRLKTTSSWLSVVVVSTTVVMSTALMGCGARLTAIPISPKARAEMGADHGIPYYAPRPYLLVTRNIAVTDEALASAGMGTNEEGAVLAGTLKPNGAARAAAAAAGAGALPATSPGGSDAPGGGGGAEPEGGISSMEDREGGSTVTHAIPTYAFRVVYLPDLSRQYALQQRGGGFGNTNVKFELEGGWLFKGTEISSESILPQVIEATTTGIASVLGASLEQVFASMFPIPQDVAGVSSVGDGGGLDLSPRIWLFEILADEAGRLNIDTRKPFFEWPPRDGYGGGRPPVDVGGRDPGPGDVRGTTPRPPVGTGPGNSGVVPSSSGGSSTSTINVPPPGGLLRAPTSFYELESLPWM